MSDTVTGQPRGLDGAPVLQRLSVLDRFLPVWIVAAMALGLGLGRWFPGVNDLLDAIRIGQTSLPIALGLLLMMYPVLAKVRYDQIGNLASDRRMLWLSLVLNWVVGPALMFTLAWVFLADQPEFRTGLIVVGLARCIAMVLIWNDLSHGDREAGALLVAVNSVFQIAAYALLGTFYLKWLPDWLGLTSQDVSFSTWNITRAVLIFLGIPLVAGYLTRRTGVARRGTDWYENRFLPKIGPVALYGLLFTIVVLFALQGEAITGEPTNVARIALPLLVYFAAMWVVSFWLSRRAGLPYERTATVAFTAAGNNFELAIAVSVGVWGVTSGQALAGVVGPLIEVPALVALVYVSLWLRRRLTFPTPTHPYIPRLAERSARGPLRSTTSTEGTLMPDHPEVLFVCVHNAGRSQMAAALLAHHAAGRVIVRSAGSVPAERLNPAVVEVMAELGLDLSREFPGPLTAESVQAADVVITMGCGDACPVFPGKRYLDWALEDPAGQDTDTVRRIRDDIDARVRSLLTELTGQHSTSTAGRPPVNTRSTGGDG